MQRGNGPRSRCRARFPGSQTAVGGGPRLRTGGTTQVHRLRTVRLAALLVGLAMVAAACGGGDDEGGDTGGGSGQIQEGGTLNYAADQEPTGFNTNTAKDNLSALSNIVTSMFPSAFNIHPDFTVKIDDEFLDSAEQTSEDPQTIVYKIKQNAVWSDDTPVSADDFIYLWENCNGTIKDNDCASTTGYEEIESVDGLRQRQDGHRRLQDPVRRLEVAVLPVHPARPLHQGAAGRLEHRAGQEPREDPLGRPVHRRELHPRPEPDPGPQRQVLRDQGQPGLDGLPVPARVDHPAGGAAEQRGRHDLPAAPARPGPAGQGAARRDQRDQLRAVSSSTSTSTSRTSTSADLEVRQAIATGLNIQELVDRTVKQFSDKATAARQPDLADRPARVPGPLRRSTARATSPRPTKLLEDAGYAKGADGIYAKGGKKLSVQHLHHRRQQAPRDPGASCSRPR